MTTATDLVRSSLSRRSVMRGGALGLAGLASAALLGCGGSSGTSAPTGGAGGSTPADSSVTGAPKNIQRAESYDPKLGRIDINSKKRIPGGTYRESATDTSRENDPDISISGADWQHIADRLFIANGWTMKILPDMAASYEMVDKQGLELVIKIRPG